MRDGTASIYPHMFDGSAGMEKDNHPDENKPADQYAAKLLSAVAGSGESFDRLIELGWEMLGNPIVITDKSWNAIAMTPGINIPDDIHWNELLTSGCLSPQSVTSAIRDNLADRLEQRSAPFVWQGKDMKYPRMLNKVSINGKLAATISLVEYCRPFAESDAGFLKMLGDAVAALLQRDNFQQFTRGIMYEDFIDSLLEGKLTDSDIVEERIKTLNIGLKKDAYVFVFDVTRYDPRQLCYLKALR